MDDFEAVAFAGLEPDQCNILWVRHHHAGHHELHFVIPRVELSSGKAFNPCPPGWQKHFDVFRDLHNHREGWARPDDPARARLRTPEHADLHKARLIRWGATPGKDERAEAKDAVHAFVLMKIEEGQVTNRSELLAALREADLEINRAGKDYVTVKDPASGEKLRLKGGIYAEHWQLAGLPGRAHAGQDRAGPAGARSPDQAAIRRLEQELAAVVGRRAAYNRSRYPGKAWTLEESIASRCQTLSWAFGRKWLQALLLSMALLAGTVLGGWGVVTLFTHRVMALQDEIQSLHASKAELENAAGHLEKRTWGLKLLENQDGRFIILPPKTSAQAGWTVGKQQAVKLE